MARILIVLLATACGSDGRVCTDGGARSDGGAGADGAISRDTSPRDVGSRDTNDVCETVRAVAEPVAATLLFQVDTSNSMNCLASNPACLTGDPTPAPDDSRWDVFTRELEGALADLPGDTRVGLMRFPQAERACTDDILTAEVRPIGESRSELLATIGSITPDGLGTPTHDGVAFGLTRLASLGAERPFLVLATDGNSSVCLGCDADCGFDSPEPLARDADDLVTRVRGAAESGIPTFVIGVPGSQGFRDVLSRIASAAGTGRAGCADLGPVYCHYDLTDPGLDFGGALRGALAEIGDAVLSCEYDIPDNPEGAFDPMRVNVQIESGGDEETIPRDPSRATGWDYTSDGNRIELFGPACERVRNADAIDILFGCPTLLI
ncbi:MAG: vWA domain-containing protein [Myxococcota bacterium]